MEETIKYEALLKEIYRLKQDKRYKYDMNAIGALEEIMFWAEEEIIPGINEKLE